MHIKNTIISVVDEVFVVAIVDNVVLLVVVLNKFLKFDFNFTFIYLGSSTFHARAPSAVLGLFSRNKYSLRLP